MQTLTLCMKERPISTDKKKINNHKHIPSSKAVTSKAFDIRPKTLIINQLIGPGPPNILFCEVIYKSVLIANHISEDGNTNQKLQKMGTNVSVTRAINPGALYTLISL